MSDLEGAYKSALNAEGSAMRENATYLDSIQGRIDLFNNAVQTMWMNFINDDVVKWIVDLGTAIVQLVDQIGLIPVAIGALSGFGIAKDVIGQDLADIRNTILKAFGLSIDGGAAAEGITKDVAAGVAEGVKQGAADASASDALADAVGKAAVDSASTDALKAKAETIKEVTDATEGLVEVSEEAVKVDAAGADAILEGVAAEDAETQAIERNTGATQQNTLKQTENVAVDRMDNTEDLKGAGTENAETASINRNTTATIANTVAQKAANIAKALGVGLLTGGLVTAATAVVGWGISKIVDAFKAEEKAIEAANDALNKYDEDQQKLKDQKETVEDLSEAYTRLSPGVNTLTNANIGLTTEAYQEYLDVCNDIAEMFPELVSGYDAQGNAIVNLKNNVESLTQAYSDSQEAAASAFLTDENKRNVWTKFKSNGMLQTGQGYYEGYLADGTYESGNVTRQDQQEILRAILSLPPDELRKYYYAASTGLDDEWEILRPHLQKLGLYTTDSRMRSTVWSLDTQPLWTEDFEGYIGDLTAELTDVNQIVADNMRGVKQLVHASLVYNPQYQALGDDARGLITTIINNMDSSMVIESGAKNADQFLEWFSNNVLAFVTDDVVDKYVDLQDASNRIAKAMSSGDVNEFNAAKNDFMNLVPLDWLDKNGNIIVNQSADEATQIVQQLAKDLQDETKNYEIRLEIRADIAIQPKRSIQEVVNEQTWNAKQALIDAVYNLESFADDATLGDIFSTIGVHLDTNDDGKLRTDEINDAYNDYLSYLSGNEDALEGWTEPQIEAMAALHALCQMYGTDIATITDEMVQAGYAFKSLDGIASFNLASESTNEFVDKFQKDVDTIKDAWESLNSGEMTQSDFLDLAQEFPELMDGVDFSDDNWMAKARENLEALNKTTVDDFITELTDMRDAMAARGEDTAIIDSMIAYAEKQRDLAQVATEVQANTVTGLTEAHEKYKSIMEETNEILYNGQKVSDGYYESLVEYIDDTEALNACFDENNKQIVTNVDALKELIDKQHEADVQNVRLAKSQAQLRYYELVRQMGDTTRAMSYFGAITDTTTDTILEQIRTVKAAIVQYQLLEDNLLGTTSAFEKFAAAKELDDQNTYGASYVEMVQVMYDALYETGQVGSAQFWAAVEATVPDNVYKHLMPGEEQIRAITDYVNKYLMPTLTFDEDSFSINYSDIENFIKKAQEVGVFSGTDTSSFGLSSDFLFGLEEGENAIEAFAERMGMTVAQVYAMLSEMDKYTTDGVGLSMLMQLDTSTSGQITYVTSELEKLYAQRKALLKQGASQAELDANMAQIYEYESQLAGLQKQARDTVYEYVAIQNALVDTSKTVREALPEEIWTKLGISGNTTVEEALAVINDYVLTLQEPTVMELEIASDSISAELDELANRFGKEELEANVVLNKENGLYEIKDGNLTIDTATLDRYVELKNAQLLIDDTLMNSMSVQEQLLTNIDKNVAVIAGEESVSGSNADNTQGAVSTNSSTNNADNGTVNTPTSEKPSPNQDAVLLTLDTGKAINALIDAVIAESVQEKTLLGPGGSSLKTNSLDTIVAKALKLYADLDSGAILAEDAMAQLSELKTEAAKWDVEIPVTLDINPNVGSTIKTIKQDVDLGNRPEVQLDLLNFGQWAGRYRNIIANPDDYGADLVARAQEALDVLESGDRVATVYPQTYYKSDFGELADGESDAAIVLTPILPDGTVLSPYQLELYAESLLNGQEIEPNITLGFFDGDNFVADAEQFVSALTRSQDALHGINGAAQEATSEVDALYGVYASYEEKLAALEAIEDKNSVLTPEEALAFGWKLAEGEILTVADAIKRLNQEQDALRQTSVYNPKQVQETTTIVKTLSDLQEEMSAYNEALAQTQEIITDNIEVSQEYKDSLIELGITEEELNECFDASNPLLVTNAKRLNELVKTAKDNVTTNIKLAKSQAQLEYYKLYKEMAKLTSGTGDMTAATYDNIQSLYGQMGAIQQSIAQFSMLEAQLLGAANAYDQLEKAQAADSANDYGSQAEELVTILGNAFNTAELGTQAAQTAFAGLIPDGVLDKTKTLDEQLQQAYEYFTNGPVSQLFTIEFDDEGNISSVDMTKENVEAFTQGLIDAGEVFHGTWDEFTLDPSIKTLDDFAAALGVTKEVAFAYLTELEKYDIGWLGGDHETLLDQLMGDNFEYQVQKTIQQMAQLQQEKANLMQGGITEDEAKRIAEINAELAALDDTMSAHKDTAYDTWQEYSSYENVLTALDKFGNKAATLTEAQALELGLEWDEDKTVQEYYDEILAKQMLLSQPTELVLQLASEQVMAELDALKADLENNTGVDIEANVHFNDATGEFEYVGDTTGWSDEDIKNLGAYLDLSNDLYAINSSIGLGIDAMEGYAQRTADAVESIDQKIKGDINADTKPQGSVEPTGSGGTNQDDGDAEISLDDIIPPDQMPGRGVEYGGDTEEAHVEADTAVVSADVVEEPVVEEPVVEKPVVDTEVVADNTTVTSDAVVVETGSSTQVDVGSPENVPETTDNGQVVTGATVSTITEVEGGATLNLPSIKALTAYIKKFEETPEGASVADIIPNDIVALIASYAEKAEGANKDGLTPSDIVARIGSYIQKETGVTVNASALANLTALIGKYQEVSQGANTDSLMPSVGAEVSEYVLPDDTSPSTDGVNPNVQAIVTSYGFPEDGVDTSGVNPQVTGIVTGYGFPEEGVDTSGVNPNVTGVVGGYVVPEEGIDTNNVNPHVTGIVDAYAIPEEGVQTNNVTPQVTGVVTGYTLPEEGVNKSNINPSVTGLVEAYVDKFDETSTDALVINRLTGTLAGYQDGPDVNLDGLVINNLTGHITSYDDTGATMPEAVEQNQDTQTTQASVRPKLVPSFQQVAYGEDGHVTSDADQKDVTQISLETLRILQQVTALRQAMMFQGEDYDGSLVYEYESLIKQLPSYLRNVSLEGKYFDKYFAIYKDMALATNQFMEAPYSDESFATYRQIMNDLEHQLYVLENGQNLNGSANKATGDTGEQVDQTAQELLQIVTDIAEQGRPDDPEEAARFDAAVDEALALCYAARDALHGNIAVEPVVEEPVADEPSNGATTVDHAANANATVVSENTTVETGGTVTTDGQTGENTQASEPEILDTRTYREKANAVTNAMIETGGDFDKALELVGVSWSDLATYWTGIFGHLPSYDEVRAFAVSSYQRHVQPATPTDDDVEETTALGVEHGIMELEYLISSLNMLIDDVSTGKPISDSRMAVFTRAYNEFCTWLAGFNSDMANAEQVNELNELIETFNGLLNVYTTTEKNGGSPTAANILASLDIGDLALDKALYEDVNGDVVLDSTIFSQVLTDAGYTEKAITDLIGIIEQYRNVVSMPSDPDPLGLNNAAQSSGALLMSLDDLGIAYTNVSGLFDDTTTIKINPIDFVNAMKQRGWTNSAIQAYFQQLGSVEFDNFQLDIGSLDELVLILDTVSNEQIEDKEFDITATGSNEALRAMHNIDGYTIDDKAYEIKTTYATEYKTIGSSTVHKTLSGSLHGGDGGNFVNGTAHARGTAYKGGSFGAETTETALVGELGPELRVRGNKWELLGEQGAEFRDVRRGDIIFNHKQTEDLLTNGYITGRGKAFAEGTVGGSAYAGIDTWDDKYGTLHENYANQGKDLSDAASDLSDAAEDMEDVFDWIEVRLEEINERISLQSAKLENAIGATKQNAIIDDIIALNQTLYKNLLTGADAYHTYAEKLLAKVPEEYRKAAQDGTIAIESFADEAGKETLEAIQNYREWVQKGADATQQAEEVLTEISNLAKQAIDNIAQEYENKLSLPQAMIEQLEAYNALIETTQGAESAKIYEAMIKENNRQINTLTEQRKKMQEELNAQVEAGNIKKYSQAWYDVIGEIAAVDTEIINLTADTNDYQDAINELHWEHLDNLMSRFEAISDEAENLIDILGDKDLVNKDTGEWTNEGIASLGLYAQQMEVAEMQAQRYAEEISYLNENWEQLGYTEQEYIEKLEELKNGQYDAIKAYNDTKDALVDLTKERVDAIKEGIEKEIEAYEELINKKKEELSAEKDLFDFQKGVANQQKNIAEIQRKLAALSSDNSASARAKRAQLEAELAEARQELEDTYYDRSVSNQQEALDKELEAFNEEKDKEMEAWDEYLENTEQVVADSLATIQANTDAVYAVLANMGQEYSLSIADALTAPWESGEDAIQSYSEKFKLSMSATVEELRKIANEHKALIEEIDRYGDKNASTVTNNVTGYQQAEKTQQQSSGGNQTESNNTTASSAGLVSSISGNIQYGNKGSNVKALQQALNELGYGNYGTQKLDGIYGSGTYQAVTAFQRAMGISADGIVGDVTKAKFKLKGYAAGTTGVKNSQLAWIDELGEELVLRPSNGRMTFMEKGTAVVPADLTANLMEWGTLDPSIMLERNKPVIGATHITNNNIEINFEFGELVHIDTVTNDTMPNLTKAIEKQMDKYMKGINNNIRKYTR